MKEIEITCKLGKELSEEEIQNAAIKALGMSPKAKAQVKYRIMRRSIDARTDILYRYRLEVYKPDEVMPEYVLEEYKDVTNAEPIVIVGAGPAGMFAALRLLMNGFKPVILERGKDVHARKYDMAKLSREGVVNPDSNYCFGEGGAGTFSDGKLYTRSSKRGDIREVLHQLVRFGADPSILIDAHPHIGTDRLPRVIENMRGTILRCGGEVHFQTKMTELVIEKGRVCGIIAGGQEMRASAVILATGHSARDVYRYLAATGVDIEAKGLAIGVRLEHPAELIDRIQYHNRQGRGKWLPAAEYSMVTQVGGRGVYSFCMCPGGFVVPAASGPEQVVVNGMSPSNRNGRWSNSGMVVEIRPEDGAHVLPQNETQDGVLSMMLLQEELERQCWLQANRLQTAPAQRMTDFVNGRLSADLNASSYAPGLIASPLHFWMPEFISTRLRDAFRLWGKQKHGFLTSEATVIGIETRTSSPVRILRDKETLQHIRLEGLFPCGEGAGYAGGIVSAGVDGERCAEAAVASLRCD